MNLNVHIERLLLEGVAVDSSELLELHLNAELRRLLADGRLPELLVRGGAAANLRADPSERRGPKSQALGVEIGRALHSGLMRYSSRLDSL